MPSTKHQTTQQRLHTHVHILHNATTGTITHLLLYQPYSIIWDTIHLYLLPPTVLDSFYSPVLLTDEEPILVSYAATCINTSSDMICSKFCSFCHLELVSKLYIFGIYICYTLDASSRLSSPTTAVMVQVCKSIHNKAALGQYLVQLVAVLCNESYGHIALEYVYDHVICVIIHCIHEHNDTMKWFLNSNLLPFSLCLRIVVDAHTYSHRPAESNAMIAYSNRQIDSSVDFPLLSSPLGDCTIAHVRHVFETSLLFCLTVVWLDTSGILSFCCRWISLHFLYQAEFPTHIVVIFM